MISRLVSPLQIDGDCCQVSCHFDETLFREETANQLGLVLPQSLRGAVRKRKAEFIAGRYCARAALSQLANDTTNRDVAIGVGANREPQWPKGFTGSITHTHGYASAIVARCCDIRAVGMDSETWIQPGSITDVSQQILTTRESHKDHLYLFESPRHYLTLVFSAKESLFKCLYPLVNRFFDFQAAVIFPLPPRSRAGGEFHFELLEDLSAEFHAGYSGRGNYAIRSNCVHTAIVLKTMNHA